MMSRVKDKQIASNADDEKIEALQHKQNGSAIEPDLESTSSSKTSKASIKGMWKKAVKSLKTSKEPKEPKEQKEPKEKRESMRERERLHSDSAEKADDKQKYSRMSSRQSSQKKGFFRKDSKDSPTATDEPEVPIDLENADHVFKNLRIAASKKGGKALDRAMSEDSSGSGSYVSERQRFF